MVVISIRELSTEVQEITIRIKGNKEIIIVVMSKSTVSNRMCPATILQI